MLRRLAIDIETAPIPELLERIPEPEVALGNLKDPIKIQEKCQAARAEQIKRAALDPHFGRIISIAVAARDSDHRLASTARTIAELPEPELLVFAWDRLANAACIVTFNGAAFDLPFLLRRSLLLGVRPFRVPCGRYEILSAQAESGHLDVCACLQQWEVGNGHSNPLSLKRDLSFYCSQLLPDRVNPRPDIDHAELGRLLEAGQVDILADINRWDAETTLLLAERIAAVYP